MEVYASGHNEKKLVSKIWLKIYLQELQKIMVHIPEEGVLKQVIDRNNHIIISITVIRSILPPKLNVIYTHHKIMCGF